jgi:hypothetical protein
VLVARSVTGSLASRGGGAPGGARAGRGGRGRPAGRPRPVQVRGVRPQRGGRGVGRPGAAPPQDRPHVASAVPGRDPRRNRVEAPAAAPPRPQEPHEVRRPGSIPRAAPPSLGPRSSSLPLPDNPAASTSDRRDVTLHPTASNPSRIGNRGADLSVGHVGARQPLPAGRGQIVHSGHIRSQRRAPLNLGCHWPPDAGLPRQGLDHHRDRWRTKPSQARHDAREPLSGRGFRPLTVLRLVQRLARDCTRCGWKPGRGTGAAGRLSQLHRYAARLPMRDRFRFAGRRVGSVSRLTGINSQNGRGQASGHVVCRPMKRAP